MSANSRFWADLSTREFAQRQASGLAALTVAVLPVGAVEQHGPHLPVSVDAALADGLVAACLPHLAADWPVLFLPTQAVGTSQEHIRFPGTLSLSPQTLMQVWTEIGESVARAGVRKLVLFNTHGGQVGALDFVARTLRTRCDMLVYSVNWWNLPLGDAVMGQFSTQEHRFGIHGGDIETSMMLALQPAHVDMARAQDFHSTSQDRAQRFAILGNGSSAKLGWQMQDYNPQGAAGNASAATAAKGQAVVAAVGRELAALLGEVVRLPLSTLVDRPEPG